MTTEHVSDCQSSFLAWSCGGLPYCDPARPKPVSHCHSVPSVGHLDVAIAVDDPLALVKEGKPLGRQGLKRGPLDLLERLADLLLRGPVDPRVGDRLFPFEEVRFSASRLSNVWPFNPLSWV